MNISKYTFSTRDLVDQSKYYLDDENFSILNPYQNNHYICLKFKDLIYSKIEDARFLKQNSLGLVKSEKIQCIKADFILVLKTKFPFFDFFYKILYLILNLVKIERLKIYPIYQNSGDFKNFIKTCDSNFLVNFLKFYIQPFFKKLSNYQCPFFEKTLLINWSNFKIVLIIPQKSISKFIETSYSFDVVLQFCSWSNFYTLFSAILQEKCIIFVHQNREILSKFIMLFVNLVKPFLWSFPIIYFLEKNNYGFMNSPLPIIIGINSTMTNFKFRLNAEKIENKVIVFYIKENILEKDDFILYYPIFNNRIAKIKRSFNKLSKYFAKKKFSRLKPKKSYIEDFLIYFRKMIERSIVDNIITFKLYSVDRKKRVEKLVEMNPKDQKFLEVFCDSQMFNDYIDKIKEILDVLRNDPKEVI